MTTKVRVCDGEMLRYCLYWCHIYYKGYLDDIMHS